MFTKKFRLFSVPLLVILVLAVMVGTAAAATSVIRASVHEFGDDPRVPDPEGAAQGTLRIEADGVTYNILTSNLDPGAAYTNWAVVFNVPGECTVPCGMDDLVPNTAVNASVFWAAGEVIPNSSTGVANFSAFIPEGEPDEDIEVLFGPGLVDTEEAEVHVIIRTHGQPIDGLLYEQLNTVGGGCGINDCFDQQGIGFVP